MNKLLTEYMDIRFIENGQVILIPEEPINAFYIVISGSVDICTAPSNE